MRFLISSIFLFILSSQMVQACFINSTSNICRNGASVFNYSIDASQTNQQTFDLFCDDFPTVYTLTLASQDSDIISLSDTRLVGVTSARNLITMSTVSKNGTTTIDIVHSNSSGHSNFCSGKVTVSNLGANTDPEPSTTTVAEVSQSTGDIIIASSTNVNVTGNNTSVSDSFAVVTPSQTETTVVVNNESILVQADTVLLVHSPGTATSPVATPPVTTLIRGSVQPSVNCSTTKDFILRTLVADITTSCGSQHRATTSSVYTATYNQTGLNGTLTISVSSGSVVVTDRSGNNKTLSAGQETTILAVVSRPSWVLPIDNGSIQGGLENSFVWTAFDGAAGYKLEYNLSAPRFSESNASAIEFISQAITLRPGDYSVFEDMILFNVFIGSTTAKIIAEIRIFAIDTGGNIISGSLSSDKVSISWE